MSDYFTAIDKNGVEREFALDLKEYKLYLDEELCPCIQEIRKIVNPNNDVHNVLTSCKKTHTLKNGVQFYYYKRAGNDNGVYCFVPTKYSGQKRDLFFLPLIPPNEVTNSKMYWEDEVAK